ncbi:MAG TPA: hypothetical protein PKC69_13995, partial [Chitinophagaceae bacterium]|nr:hypothetical protein [Chitinophagaceae bacterium]
RPGGYSQKPVANVLHNQSPGCLLRRHDKRQKGEADNSQRSSINSQQVIRNSPYHTPYILQSLRQP